MPKNGKKIGEILIGSGIITTKTLQRALQKAQREHSRVGSALERMEVVTDEEVAWALGAQYGYRTLRSLAVSSLALELLGLVPADMAIRSMVFPLKLEANVLCLALSDPTDIKLLPNMAQNNGLKIVPYLVTRREILAAIKKHYCQSVAGKDNRETVLIVDDNAAVLGNLELLLTKAGYRVLTARDGMEAFRCALIEKPGVVVTDKEMPKLDGYRLLASLQALPETRDIPVMLHTSSASSTEEADAFEKGFCEYVPKPVQDATLLTRIKRSLRFNGDRRSGLAYAVRVV